MLKRIYLAFIFCLFALSAQAQTTILSLTINSNNPGSTGFTLIQQLVAPTLSGAFQNRATFTFNPGISAGGSAQYNNVWVCKTAAAPNCSSPPIRITFTGTGAPNSTGILPQGTTGLPSEGETSALITLTGDMIGATDVLICWEATQNNAGNTVGLGTAVSAYYKASTTGDCQLQTRGSGYSNTITGIVLGLSQIITQTSGGGGGTTSRMMLMGVQ